MAEKWQSKRASQEHCRRIVKIFGIWLTFVPYLASKQQIVLQGLDHWTYETAVPRVIRIVPLRSVYFPCGEQILTLQSNKVKFLKQDFDSARWRSIQIQNHIFQVKAFSKSTRMLENDGSSRFSLIEKAPMNQSRDETPFCYLADQFIFTAGGTDENGDDLSSVERYDLVQDVWEEMPQMNMARFGHGICTLGTAVFVFCGSNYADGVLNSVEKLETLDLEAGWQLIQMPPTSLLTPRGIPVVAALNQREILIMGGYNGGCFDDTLTFNTGTNSVKRVVQGTPLKFADSTCSAQVIRPGVIIALVYDFKCPNKLIEYRSGSTRCLYTMDF